MSEITCACGATDAGWRGDPLGARTYCCEECWTSTMDNAASEPQPMPTGGEALKDLLHQDIRWQLQGAPSGYTLRL